VSVWLACSSSSSSKSGDAATDSGPDPCGAPLAQSTACAASFDMQVANNPCDPDMPTQAMCGRYKVWTSIVVGSETCVYDTGANGALVGARSCGSVTTDPACQGCINFGIAHSLYATCGAETPACPP
jgi:hypothetical protein